MIKRTQHSFNQTGSPSLFNYSQPTVAYESLSHSQSQSIGAASQHKTDLLCFQSCSNWNLTLTAVKNKKILSSSAFLGILSQSFDSMMPLSQSFPQDITAYLPIDLSKNQRFVLDTTQPRMNLSMVFDLNGRINHFTTIGPDYSSLLFEVKIIGVLHKMNLLKDPIEFTVKGYDIKKSISEVLNEKKINLAHIVSRDEANTVFNATVFCNIQCSFAIEFSVSNQEIAEYLKLKSQTNSEKNNSLNKLSYLHLGIIVIKLKIIYYLPLCVFSYLNYKGFNSYQQLTPRIVNQYQIHTQSLDLYNIQNIIMVNERPNETHECNGNQHKGMNMMSHQNNNSNNGNNCTSKLSSNFCNWFSFMTYTTPMIYEVKHLLLKEVLSSFIHSSLFGVKCVLKVGEHKYTQVNYYPSLSSVYIEYLEEMLIKSNSNTNESSVHFSNIPFCNNDYNYQLDNSPILIKQHSASNDSKVNSFYYKDRGNKHNETRTFKENMKEIFKPRNNLNTKTLGDITHNSWFSIIWTPAHPHTKLEQENNQDIIKVLTSFKVFYRFRNATISKSTHFLPIAGIFDNSICKKNNDTVLNQLTSFWFSNFSVNVDNNQLLKDKVYNSNLFYTVVEKACRLEYFNNSF